MSYRIAIPDRIKPALEKMAIAHDCWHGDLPSIPKLITLLADGNLEQGSAKPISFYEQLVLAIAKGLAANESTTDYSPSHFGRIVRDRADAIFCEPTDDSVYAED